MARYKALLCDAGGVLFEESFWLDRLERRYRRLRRAAKTAVALKPVEFGYLSNALSSLYHTTRDLDINRLLGDVYSVFGASYSPPREAKRQGFVKSGVREVLAEVRRGGVSVSVLTDAPLSGEELRRRYQRVLCDDRGMPLIDHYISSQDIGATKPCRIVYEQALRVLGLQPADVLVVAHDIDEILGARLAGGLDVFCVYVDPREEKLARSFATHFGHHLRDVLSIL